LIGLNVINYKKFKEEVLMNNKTSSFVASRRQFLQNVFPAGAIFCFGCRDLLALRNAKGKQEIAGKKHKFLEDSGMTLEEVFKFAYQENSIPLMQSLAKEIGKENFIKMLKKVSSENAAQMMTNMTQTLPKKDFDAFTDFLKNILNAPPYKNALVYEIVKETDKETEIKYSECLWAKIFREVNAADIGYATQCYPSDAMIHAFNPKIKVTNPKNLMKGDDICIERFVWEG